MSVSFGSAAPTHPSRTASLAATPRHIVNSAGSFREWHSDRRHSHRSVTSDIAIGTHCSCDTIGSSEEGPPPIDRMVPLLFHTNGSNPSLREASEALTNAHGKHVVGLPIDVRDVTAELAQLARGRAARSRGSDGTVPKDDLLSPEQLEYRGRLMRPLERHYDLQLLLVEERVQRKKLRNEEFTARVLYRVQYRYDAPLQQKLLSWMTLNLLSTQLMDRRSSVSSSFSRLRNRPGNRSTLSASEVLGQPYGNEGATPVWDVNYPSTGASPATRSDVPSQSEGGLADPGPGATPTRRMDPGAEDPVLANTIASLNDTLKGIMSGNAPVSLLALRRTTEGAAGRGEQRRSGSRPMRKLPWDTPDALGHTVSPSEKLTLKELVLGNTHPPRSPVRLRYSP